MAGDRLWTWFRQPKVAMLHPGGLVQSYAPNQILTQVPGSRDGENMVPDLEKENISSNDLNSESLTGLV